MSYLDPILSKLHLDKDGKKPLECTLECCPTVLTIGAINTCKCGDCWECSYKK